MEDIIKHGEDKLFECNKTVYATYFGHVKEDFEQLKSEYPFSEFHFLPTSQPSLLYLTVIAVGSDIIEAVNGKRADFTGEYSKLLYISVPFNYRNIGCEVYGCKWFDANAIQDADVHFYRKGEKIIENKYGYRICVGVPESFPRMKNVILESVRTADNILVAYERLQCGASDKVILNAYSHGNTGKMEYSMDKNKYRSR